METSSDKPQPPSNRVKNVLVRYSGFLEFTYWKGCEHPENLHLLRYFPKYFKTLRLRITSQNPLLSKIKKIKKIKQIKTLNFSSEKSSIKKNWLTLFGNHRREIEEIPQIAPVEHSGLPVYSFWTKLSLKEARFFYNVRSHCLPVGSENDSGSRKTSQENTLFKYFKNMGWQKRLEFYVNTENYDEIKWILQRLEKKECFLPILRMLKIQITRRELNLFELFSGAVLTHLRDLSFFWEFKKYDPSLLLISVACKNLRSLDMSFERFFHESPRFSVFLLSLQELEKLETLKLRLLGDAQDFLNHLKLPRDLNYLGLSFNASNLLGWGDGESRDVNSYPNLVEHWEDMRELETLTCNFECDSHEEVHLTKVFVTMLLKKALNLKSFRSQICLQENLSKDPPAYEPFFVEQVPHLYESLQKFRARLCDCYFPLLPVQFDLKMLKPFKRLKKIKLTGRHQFSYVNIEEAIDLLQNNGGLTKLSLNGMMIQSKAQLQEILEKVSNAKSAEKNLKIQLDLTLYRIDKENKTRDLDELCEVLNSIKLIKGTLLRLYLIECEDVNFNEMREIIEKYPLMQNCIIEVMSFIDTLTYVKMKGCKEQLFSDQ